VKCIAQQTIVKLKLVPDIIGIGEK